MTQDRPHPTVKVEPTARRCAWVILTGRAISVPEDCQNDASLRRAQHHDASAAQAAELRLHAVETVGEGA
jgi:hypothetical protein